MKASVISAAPHAHDSSSVRGIMLTVVVSLLPVTAVGLYLYGWPAANLLAVTVLSGLAFESLALFLRGEAQSIRLMDGSAVVAGWLLALTLPPHAPFWIGILGSLIAMLMGKHAFGGVGQNVFNPAMLARVVLLLAFPVQMTTWPSPFSPDQADPAFGFSVTFLSQAPDGISGATWLSEGHHVVANTREHVSTLLWGIRSGSLGESSLAAVFVGGLLLVTQRVISWHIPLSVIAGIFIPALAMGTLSPDLSHGPLTEICSGGLFFTAVFIATDPTTSPSSSTGKVAFGLGIGLAIFIIRNLCSLPEGAAFAVLTMNALVPILDRRLKPRVYGRTRRGAPLSVSEVSR